MRGRQLARHYFDHLTCDPAAMSDLPATHRAQLVSQYLPTLLSEVKRQSCDAGATVKILYGLFDQAAVETVVMAYPERVTACISTQVGCAMGCPFCATGRQGLTRSLSAAEMVDQVRLAAALVRQSVLPASGHQRLSNVVLMGQGEPMAAYSATVQALRVISQDTPNGLGISARKLTVSTCGLIPGIERLSTEGLPVRLAISLHAPDDEARDQLVPINAKYPVAKVLEAAHGYFLATGRRVSIEYALIRGINDQQWRARLLAERLRHHGTKWVHVNPIPLNPVDQSPRREPDGPLHRPRTVRTGRVHAGSRPAAAGKDSKQPAQQALWQASGSAAVARFVATLEAAGLAVTLRDTRGREIDGACGQLAASEVGGDR